MDARRSASWPDASLAGLLGSTYPCVSRAAKRHGRDERADAGDVERVRLYTGAHDELLARGDAYRQLYHDQFAGDQRAQASTSASAALLHHDALATRCLSPQLPEFRRACRIWPLDLGS